MESAQWTPTFQTKWNHEGSLEAIEPTKTINSVRFAAMTDKLPKESGQKVFNFKMSVPRQGSNLRLGVGTIADP